jgi:deazaflavin-dependent oxidoreductase (nitroreductase family)
LIGPIILLLTTTGRKSGLARVTALQYAEIDGLIHVTSARGTAADWYRNLVAHPGVTVQVKNRRFSGQAETTTDPALIAAFLRIRLQRHPRMIGRLMRAQGLPPNPTAVQLQDYATHLALVIIHPDG